MADASQGNDVAEAATSAVASSSLADNSSTTTTTATSTSPAAAELHLKPHGSLAQGEEEEVKLDVSVEAAAAPVSTPKTFAQTAEKEEEKEMADPWAESNICRLSCYHGALSRHIAETLLMTHGVEGSYLLRRSESSKDHVTLTLSVR